MVKTLDNQERQRTLGEEIANSISHGIGFLAVAGFVPVLIVTSVRHGAVAVVGACVFSATMILLFITSTLYHSLARNKAKRIFRILDHTAIYLMIAGTYTPFTLGVLRGGWGWSLFGIIWGLALIGVVLKAVGGVRFPIVGALIYLAMAWLVALIGLKPLLESVPARGLVWLLAGGIAYTVGVAFYAADKRVPYSHFVWHLFVIAGSACHFVAVLKYAI